MRHLFERYGGSLGAVGCVAWMFSQKGLIVFQKDQIDEEELFELALEAGADDIKEGTQKPEGAESTSRRAVADRGRFFEMGGNVAIGACRTSRQSDRTEAF